MVNILKNLGCERESLGKVLKAMKEWLENNFKISDDKIKELINIYSF